MATATTQQDIINRRLPIVTGSLIAFSILLLLALARLQQLSPDVQREFEIRAQNNTSSIRRLPAVRGVIYDRAGVPLAFNVLQYEVGVSPNLVTEPRRVAQELGLILNLDEFEIYNRITQPVSWVQIARPVSAELGQQIADLGEISITIDPLSRRAYPQGSLAGPLIGFVIEDNDNTRGAIGIESSYNNELAGRPMDQTVSTIPFDIPVDLDNQSQRGMNLVLTIDRDIQYWMEYELERAVSAQNASGGNIIVMDPRNGEILAMASNPSFDPNNFITEDPQRLQNSAISGVFEPGSIMKVLTVAAAIDTGAIPPEWTYNDTGEIVVGGVTTLNWDRRAYGVVDVTALLVNSLNVGATTVALETGPETFYSSMRRFGLGISTRVDLPGEEGGSMRMPGEEGWSESDLAANSYGQALLVTPLQMITAFSAIANDGLMYQPRLVRQIINGDEVRNSIPTVTRVISATTANTVTDMMVRVVNEGATNAQIPGYTIAGKTGTAQIATPLGYEDGPNTTIATFVGFFPADDPQVVVLIRLDRPNDYWGSVAAAPVFRDVAQRLALLLGIPTDEIRLRLQEAGGVVNSTR